MRFAAVLHRKPQFMGALCQSKAYATLLGLSQLPWKSAGFSCECSFFTSILPCFQFVHLTSECWFAIGCGLRQICTERRNLRAALYQSLPPENCPGPFHLIQLLDCRNSHGSPLVFHVKNLTLFFGDLIISSFLCQLSQELLILSCPTFISRPHFANFQSAQPNSVWRVLHKSTMPIATVFLYFTVASPIMSNL